MTISFCLCHLQNIVIKSPDRVKRYGYSSALRGSTWTWIAEGSDFER